MADCKVEQGTDLSADRPEPRDRSKSYSAGQRPQPKPRKRVEKSQSIHYTGNSDPLATSSSAGSSPQLSRATKYRSILQATPLVQALTNQLMSTLNHNSNTDEQQKDTESGNDLTDGTQNPPLHSNSTHSPVIRRERAYSEPKSRTAPPRPPPPTHPPPPNPRLSSLMSEYRAPNSVIHVIDSRSKTPPARRPEATSARKTTKYGTPPPRRPAPPPPKGRENKKEEEKASQRKTQDTPVPKLRNSPIPKLRSSPVPKPRNPESFNQDSVSNDEVQHQNGAVSTSTTKEHIDQCFPIYEDLDKDDIDYEILDPIVNSEEEEEENGVTMSAQGDLSANSDNPPALPPKKGSKVTQKEGDELPPLPPRLRPATNVKTHRLLKSQGEVHKRKDSEKEEEEAIEDTGVYEPINYQDSDNESHESYTEMNDPDHMPTTSDDDDLENDKPEDIYITMDPHAYIPPPENYKPKKNKATSKGN